MKRLIKQNAKQVGEIYHYTDLRSLIEILKTDTLGVKNRPTCFTRNQHFHSIIRSVQVQCRLVIDGNKLSENYKIYPYNDKEWIDERFFGTDEMEQEERIDKEISPIIPYITYIDIFKSENTFQQLEFLQYDELQFDNIKNLEDLTSYIQNNYHIIVDIR